jgi:xanthine dehydrogenase accessory factor
VDIFVEPVLPRSQMVICGSSPTGVAVADLAKRIGLR